MTSPDDFERRLRASLDKHAGRAPSGDRLDELIIAEAVHGVTPIGARRPTVKGWLFPVLAVAAVAAVVLSIVGITAWRPDSSPVSPAHSGSTSDRTYSAIRTPSPTTKKSSSPSPSTRTTTNTDGGQGYGGSVANDDRVRGFNATDLTFISSTEGWALGSAKCLPDSGRTGRCTAIYRTTNGSDWKSVSGAAFNVAGDTGGCAAPCVTNIRFANQNYGYAYGPDTLFMTSNGGATWTEQKGAGGAVALETLDDNVIRLVSRNGLACGAGCDLHVETSAIGSTDWTSVALPGGAKTSDTAQLVRAGSSAYVLVTINAAGDAQSAGATLFVSTDDGASWSRHSGDPCPQLGNREVDARSIAAGSGDVSVLCSPRAQPDRSFVAVSTNGGGSFAATTGRLDAEGLLTGDPNTVLVAAGANASRSLDGGKTWQPIPALSGRPGGVSFVGFESQTVGRAITDSGTRILTTSNAGATWNTVSFPS